MVLCKLQCKLILYMKATVSAILYKSKLLANGEHPIMLRVCYNGKRAYKSLKLSCFEKDWNQDKGEVRSKHPLSNNINSIVNKELSVLREIVLNYERTDKPYSAKILVEEISKPLPSRKTLLELIDDRVQYFKIEKGQHNTGTGYRTLYNLIKRFSPNKDYELFEINRDWLREFEDFLRKTNKRDTSIYKHFCCLKASINHAASKGLIPISNDPFNGFEQNLDRRTKKRALSLDEMNSLIHYFTRNYLCTHLENDHQLFYENYVFHEGKALRHDCEPISPKRDEVENIEDKTVRKFWNEYFKKEGYNKLHPQLDSEGVALSLFLCSYIMQGLAMIDLANLRWKDLKLLSILDEKKYLHDFKLHDKEYAEANKIFKHYYEINLLRNKTKKPTRIILSLDDFNAFACLFLPSVRRYNENNYIFGIFDIGQDEATKFGRMTYVNYLVNHNLKKAAKRAGLNSDITFYSARHSYASQLYHQGVSVSLIAQNMGRDISNIETYLKEFDDKRIIEANKNIWFFNTSDYQEIEG